MLKRSLFAVFAVLLLAATGDSAWRQHSATVAATSTNSTVTFVDNRSGGPGGAFKPTLVRFRNAGPNTAFIDCQDATATTADLRVVSGAELELIWQGPPGTPRAEVGFTSCGIICTAAETATVHVNAWRW